MKINKTDKRLLQDRNAPSAKKRQPFFVRKKGEKVYTGFPLIQETETDGWIYGAITDFLEPDSKKGCTHGDGYIQAPDGSRAGIVWDTRSKPYSEVFPPDTTRWGVYDVMFQKPIKSTEDLIYNFRYVLPYLIERYYMSKYRELNNILNEWDFLGVVNAGVYDEYSDILYPIVIGLEKEIDNDELKKLIISFVKKHYSYTPNPKRADKAIEKIINWWNNKR